MKKSITVLFLLLLAVCGTTGAFAQSESDFEIEIEDGKVTITNYTGNGGIVVVPATIGGKPIAKIGGWTFSRRTDITSIRIPASVTSIDDSAFFNCTGLTSIQVDVNNNHYTNRNGVLFNKNVTVLITYPAGLKGQYAIPVGVTSIGGWAFSFCIGLTSVNIPASVTSIGWGAFSECTGLTSISIPASVTRIEYWAFSDCTGLRSITLPSSLISMGNYVFKSCTGLTSITIPGNVSIHVDSVNDGDFSGYYDFVVYYGANGKKSGVYTFRNGAWSYAAQ